MAKERYTFKQWCLDNGERGKRLWNECTGLKEDGTPVDMNEVAYATPRTRVGWICAECGYKWYTSVGNRTRGTECKQCAINRQKKERVSKIRITFLDYCMSIGERGQRLLNEFGEGLDEYGSKHKPDEVGKGSHNIKFLWTCQDCGNRWWMSISRRVYNNGNCDKCGKYKTTKKKAPAMRLGDWCNANGEWGKRIIEEYTGYKEDGSGPFDINYFSSQAHDKVIWRCMECNGTYPSLVRNRTVFRTICKKCAIEHERLRRIGEKGSLKAWCKENNREDILKSFTGKCISDSKVYTADSIAYGSNKTFEWKCEKCGQLYKLPMSTRTLSGQGCKICSQTKNGTFLDWCNCNGDRGKQLLEEYIGDTEDGRHFEPNQIAPKSDEKVSWRCNKGHIYPSRVSGRTRLGHDCPYCNATDSFPERFIRYSLCQVFTNFEHNVPIGMNSIRKVMGSKATESFTGKKKTEIDMVFRHNCRKVCIEYNGEWAHRNKAEFDELKRKFVVKKGYEYIQIIGRIKGSDRFKDCMTPTQINYVPYPDYRKKDHIEQLKKIVAYIVQLYGEDVSKVDFDKALEQAQEAK